MGVYRLFLGPYNAKIFGEKIKVKKEKHNKAFDEILKEEQDKLAQLVSKMGKKWNTEILCCKYNLKTNYNTAHSGE